MPPSKSRNAFSNMFFFRKPLNFQQIYTIKFFILDIWRALSLSSLSISISFSVIHSAECAQKFIFIKDMITAFLSRRREEEQHRIAQVKLYLKINKKLLSWIVYKKIPRGKSRIKGRNETMCVVESLLAISWNNDGISGWQMKKYWMLSKLENIIWNFQNEKQFFIFLRFSSRTSFIYLVDITA